MVVSTKAVVLSALKYGDTSLIVKCYTENEGAKSYMLRGVLSSKKGKLKTSYFQPTTQLKIIANHNNKGTLNSIKEVEIINHYHTIFIDITKQSIALFISEILNYSLQEEEKNEGLYEFLETAFIWLDTHNKISNFHLLFLLNLTKYLGFYPETTNFHYNYFDLDEGSFKTFAPKYNFITGDNLISFKKLLGTNFEALNSIEFSAKIRQQILKDLIRYFELHLTGFRKPKSLDVLTEIFR
ncbi:DNA repair protein RecO [Urechidicola croceus]|uniref:DNA repair protein RecO n=1 Tax=Urechidicola croceus TaxID=1850246 RepID=A0A1D8P986_9FLAO|nr:DNA repair protein RecO [Urechidicola croceus]AOW21140.1 DNA repair protein RecO [Urechidicola croceus]